MVEIQTPRQCNSKWTWFQTMQKLLDAGATMPHRLICCHAYPACLIVHHTAPSCLFVQSFSYAPLPCASSRVGCAWEQAEFTVLALDDAILPFLQQNGREELHCIACGFDGPSERKRWGILAPWRATVSMKGVESLMDMLQPPSEIKIVGGKWLVSKERGISLSLKHHWVCVL